MEYAVVITDELLEDLFEIAESMLPNYVDASRSFPTKALAILGSLSIFPQSRTVVKVTNGVKYRLCVVGHCTAIFYIEVGTVFVTRLFGPGRNWQASL